jgi:hypothetical protein
LFPVVFAGILDSPGHLISNGDSSIIAVVIIVAAVVVMVMVMVVVVVVVFTGITVMVLMVTDVSIPGVTILHSRPFDLPINWRREGHCK